VVSDPWYVTVTLIMTFDKQSNRRTPVKRPSDRNRVVVLTIV